MFSYLLSWIFYVRHILAAVWSVLSYIFKIYLLGRPVSFPGNPIANPLRRRGEWPTDRKQYSVGEGWRFTCDKKSHTISQKVAPRYEMTGESAGRQIWYKEDVDESSDDSSDFYFKASKNPNSADKLFRNFMLNEWDGEYPDIYSEPQSAGEAARKGFQFYQMLQCDDGHWAGDYGGPNFLMPGLVCVLYLTKAPFPDYKKKAMVAYLKNHQQVDGGWGTHIECASTMFGTILSYITLRLLGESQDADYMVAALEFIHSHGGALYAPSWAKFWMAVIGIYDWKGINSIPAEMWLLPNFVPFHPGKLWCHCRMVYLPMCYMYSSRYIPSNVEKDSVLMSLRSELYLEEYDTIDWDAYRQTCADIDAYSPLQPVMKLAQDFLAFYETWLLPNLGFLQRLRKKALYFVEEYIHAEDKQTNYVDIGPVNKALNMLCVYVASGENKNAEEFQRHLPRIDDYLWVAEDGMKMQGYNGSQCWDTSFAVQAIVEGDLAKEFPECAKKVYEYLDRTQIKTDEDNRERYYRHVSKGGWPFSTAAHGWPISDCTAEGLKGVLCLHKVDKLIPKSKRISTDRLQDSVDIILSLHNADGGWATYENNRGYGWYEMFNPSEVFGDIMIDYSYVECSSACITALKTFAKEVPNYRTHEVLNAIQAGRTFIKSIQRNDGSWYGSWGVCFTYATWFGIEGLVAAGESTDAPCITNALEYLLSKQNPNGGWGESYYACVNKSYPADGTSGYGEDCSGVVQTSWALLGLIKGDCKNVQAINRGIDYLMRKQLPTGDWDQEGITGVFNRSCGITYTAYRNVFPVWALLRYRNKYEN